MRDIRAGHVLLVGPRLLEGDVVGGPQVLFESLVAELRVRGNLDVTVLDTARPLASCSGRARAWLDVVTFLRVFAHLWSRVRAADLVVWCVSPKGAMLAGPFVWSVCNVRRRPLCIRLSGGSFDVFLAAAPAIVRAVARTTFLRSQFLLVQTRRLANRLQGCNTRWIPNTRNLPPRRSPYRPSCRRLLFLSNLVPAKGLSELLSAARSFPPGVRLSIYGPDSPALDVVSVDVARNVNYGGVVPPDRVPLVMEAHDVLVLPTRYRNEGYPGVVIEAFQMGLPVIVTRLPSLTELVTEQYDGLFVDPGSVESLSAVVVRLCSDDRLFRRLREGALLTGARFRRDYAADLIERFCRRAPSLPSRLW